MPPPETRYRNMRSNSDASDLPAAALLAQFARDSEVQTNTMRYSAEGQSHSVAEDCSFRSSVTDSTRRRNLGWRRKRHSDDVTASFSHAPDAIESIVEATDGDESFRDRKPSAASVASPLPKFIAFTPPARPMHGAFASRRVLVDANGSPFAGWEGDTMAPRNVRHRESSPLKRRSGKRLLQDNERGRDRAPLGSLRSYNNIEAKSKIPKPASKAPNEGGQQPKPKGRSSKSKPKTPKIIPLKHEPLPTRRGPVYLGKENVV